MPNNLIANSLRIISEAAPRLYEVNGGDFLDAFDLYDISVESARYYHGQFMLNRRRYIPLIRRYYQRKAPIFAEIYDTHISRMNRHHNDIIEWLYNRESILNNLYDTSWLAKKSLNCTQRFFRLRDSNTTQNARDHIDRFLPVAMDSFNDVYKHIHRMELAHGFQFSMRPLYAFPSTYYNEIQQRVSTRSGMLGMWMPIAYQDVLEYLRRRQFDHAVNLTYEERTHHGFGATDRAEAFSLWDGLSAHFVTCDTHNQHYGMNLVTSTPPALTMEWDRKWPIFFNEKLNLPYVDDEIRFMKIADTAALHHENYSESLTTPSKAFMEFTALVSLYAALLSIIVAGIKTGKGQTKPRWLHTPLNAEVVVMTAKLTQMPEEEMI